jgi:hypothetical protein
MALQLFLTADQLRDNGISSIDIQDAYLKIVQVSYNYQPEEQGGMTVASFALWRSKAEREANIAPLRSFIFSFSGPTPPDGDLFAHGYEVAKATGEISGLDITDAVDC